MRRKRTGAHQTLRINTKKHTTNRTKGAVCPFLFLNQQAKMKLRLAQPSDIEILATNNNLMAQETEGKELDMPTVLKGVKAIFDNPQRGFYLVVEVEGDVAANLMVTYEWSDWRNSNIWWIQSVYVAKNHRRKGLYKAMYNEVKQMAKLEGVKVIRLYVEEENTVAQQTYKNLGMQHSYYHLYEADI